MFGKKVLASAYLETGRRVDRVDDDGRRSQLKELWNVVEDGEDCDRNHKGPGRVNLSEKFAN